MKYILFTLIASICIFTSCSKEKNSKWVVLDLNVTNAETGLPEESKVWLEYYYQAKTGYSATPQDHTGKIDLGTTTGGKLYTEVDVSETTKKLYLKIQPLDYEKYPSWFMSQTVWTKVISRSASNNIHTELTPHYFRVRPFLNNISCYDATDTLWLQMNSKNDFEGRDTYTFTGCMNNYVDEPIVLNSYYRPNFVHFKLKTKKDGILDSMFVVLDVEPTIVNESTLSY